MSRRVIILLSLLMPFLSSAVPAAVFNDDVEFLKKYTDVIVLQSPDGRAQVALSAKLQGRVMTSTAGGANGQSFGWINRDYFADVASGKVNKHISPYGGEDRFWLGPEGGQFAIFFAPGTAFDLDHWFTPPAIDTEPFNTVSSGSDQARFTRHMSLTNFSGTKFELDVERTIRLLSPGDAWKQLGVDAKTGVNLVAFESENAITNTGDNDWSKKKGLLSIWILGMFNASPATVVAIPVKPGDGPAANDDYFAKVPPDRLKASNDVVYFKADANFRSKIGIPPARVKPVAGSYDSQNKV